MKQEKAIFKRGSTTFFLSSLFFPTSIKKDVFDLYSFVRVADDYVDRIPADAENFYNLRRQWTVASADPDFDSTKHKSDTTNVRAVKNMLRLTRKHNFDLAWVESFLDTMESDLTHAPFQRNEELSRYVYGSAEVVGLMMAKIMGLKSEAYEAAQLQGRALQLLNFIRDVSEDLALGRQYFPQSDLKKFNLPNLIAKTATSKPKEFTQFIHQQLDQYEIWQQQAYAGYTYIPKRLRIPLQTAAEMYSWTAQEIRKNPMVIYEKKVKPSKVRIIRKIIIGPAVKSEYRDQ